MAMEHVSGSFSTIKFVDYAAFATKAGFPKEVGQQYLGSKITVILTPVDSKPKSWNMIIECKEMPHMKFEVTFEDGVEIERDIAFFGGKTKMLHTSTGNNTFHVKYQNDIMGTLLMEEAFSPDGVHTKLFHPGSSSTMDEFWFRDGKPMDMSNAPGLYRRVKDQHDVDFAIKVGFPEEVAKKFLGVEIITGLEAIENNPKSRRYTIECPEMPHLNFEGTYEENIEHEVDMAYFGGKTKALIQPIANNRFFARYKNETIGTLLMDEVYAPNGVFVKVIHKESGAVLDEIWKRV